MGGGGEGGLRVPTSDPHTINACWFLFLLSAYLIVAEAASFDKKELCRSDTDIYFFTLSLELLSLEDIAGTKVSVSELGSVHGRTSGV